VVVAGGSRGLTGAPTMVALAAQRTGAGYVQVAVPESAEQALELRLLEAMTKGMPEADGTHTEAGAEQVAEMAERAGAVVLGPGIGKGDNPRAFARKLTRATGKPLLIDADGLNAHVGALDELAERDAPTVLTPHAGELGRLLEVDSSEIERRRLHHAREAAERAQAVVVLKGDDTIVAQPGELSTAISPGATPALATAGTGDVLSGIVGALLSKGLDAFEAAAAGVLVHARAGIHAADDIGADHVVAGDVIDAIPVAFAR
jgi:NAD(P)H-hydrate epimerase